MAYHSHGSSDRCQPIGRHTIANCRLRSSRPQCAVTLMQGGDDRPYRPATRFLTPSLPDTPSPRPPINIDLDAKTLAVTRKTRQLTAEAYPRDIGASDTVERWRGGRCWRGCWMPVSVWSDTVAGIDSCITVPTHQDVDSPQTVRSISTDCDPRTSPNLSTSHH